MKKCIFILAILASFLFSVQKSYATHGLPIIGLTGVNTGTGITVSGGSDAATCGSGPYWMQVEIVCNTGALTGTPPATLQTTLANGAGGATTFNSFPWFNSLLNIPTMTAANGWSDACVAGEQYNNITIPFAGLCPGQTYFWAAREWVGGSNSPGPWSAAQSFVVPGVLTPLNFNISASPATYCAPGSSNLSVTGVTGGCGTQSILWSTGSTAPSIVVSPANTTVYTCTVSAPCMTPIVKSVTVTVVTALSAAFVPTNTTICTGSSQVFTHTGTAGVSHNWAVSPAAGVTVSTPTSTNPSITFANPGSYVVSHTVTAGACNNVVTTNVTVVSVTSPFTIPSASQCLTGNSFSFNNTGTAGGTHTYTFNPSAGAPATGNTPNYTGSFTAPGTYTVVHTVVSGGCTSVTSNVVTVNPMPAATLSFTNPGCGMNNGVVVINNTSPASPPQTITSFASSLGSVSGQTVTGLGAGTPVITLTNNFGCTFTVSATLTSPTGPTDITTSSTNPTCGSSNGSITFGTPTGGTGPYTYSVNGTSSPSPANGLGSGSYSITVRDVNGCVFTKVVALASGTGPTAISGTPGAASCGLNNGTYTVTGVTGGTPAYTYSLDGVSTGSVTTGLAAGTHTILVSDAGGCTFNTTFNVVGGVGPTSGTVATTNASCGSANGSATVTGVTGGTLPYTYSYDGGAFAAGTTTAGLSAGNHTVAIRDAGGCTLNVPFTISNTGSPSASITGSTNISCFGGSNGSFTVTPTGGTAPYTYTLATPFSSNGTGQFSGLPQGSYNITIKDAVGCITTTSLTLTQPTAVSITPTGLDALCNGVANGTVNVTGSGGTPTYSYNLNGGAYQTGTSFANVGAATYVMGIRDANGCIATQTVIVNQPSALTINVSTQNANCTAANGVASATVGGGTPIYTYTWTGGGGAAATSNSVVSGNYTVTATDANGCTISSPAVIGNTPGGTAVISASANVTCNGACNGSLTASPVGGVAPFTYSWSPGGQTNATATNLCPGTYTCTITDFYGCKSFASATITQPPVLTAIMNSQNVKCFGTATGTVSAAGSGGTAPYTYLWTSPITNTASTVSNVAIGSYVCNVTDANGCTITQSITVTQPTSVTLTSSVTPANCNQANGSATININGGTPAYTQTWSAGSTSTVQGGVAAGTYTINVHDANNCVQTLAVTIPNLSGPSIAVTSFTNVSCFGGNNGAAVVATSGGASPYIYSWSHGGGAPAATNLTAGTYTVSATDQAGCVASTSVTITEPPVLTVSLVVTQPKCFGATNGGGVASVTGGVNPYTYTWTSTGGNAFNSNPLGAGNYGLTTTDANGCIVTSTMSLVNPPAMAASITSTNVSCFGVCDGIAVASSTNGIVPVDYFWTGGPIGVPSQTLTGACAGTYTVTATDFNNCTAIAQVTITQPTAVTASISATGSVTCNGGNNGFATVSGAGGTGAYTYSWNPGSSTGATSNSLTAGSYVATVKDANQCVATATAVIIEPTPLATTLTTTNPNCNGVCDGTGNVAFGGGAGTTTFQWLPGLQSGNAVNNLCAGSNSVIITSNGACPTTLTFTLTEPALLTAVVSSTNSNCGQANGKTCAVVSGGTAPYNNLWSNGVTTLCNNNVTSGAYTITVTDANNCTATAAGLINDIAGPVVSVASSTNVSCFNGNNGAANSNITGGVTPYTISWSNGQSTANATGFTSGVKTLMVTDAAGCVGTASVQITEPTQFVSAIGSSTNVSCFGLSDGGATLLTNGGTTPYTYNWTPSGATGSVVVNVPAASYSVVATDANGCTSTAQVTITQPQALVLASSSFSNVSCNGGSNGLITTAVQGGVPAYNYSWTPAQTNSGNLNGLSAGAYAVTITDANNCSISSNFNITEPSALTSTYTSLPATCGLANGSATITINGGTPGYSATWNGGTPNPSGTISTSMSPGTNWQATITDSKGCTITQTISIANPPVPAITGFSVTSPSCFGLSNGDITVNYSTGTAPYTITWSNPISQTLTTSALSQSVAGVSAGLYTATLSDSYGCTSSQPVNVTQPSMLTLVPTPNITICYGQSTQISASGQGGTPVYSYTWAPNPFVGGGPHSVNPTVTSQYTVTVSDSKGCSTSPKIITVNVTPQLLVTGTSTTICHNGSTDLIPTITSPGNGGPYTYAWTPTSATTSSINVVGSAPSGSVSNTYTLTVDDGCTIPSGVAVFTVNVNPLPVIDFVGTPTAGCAPLTVTLTGTSDGANDVFTWSDGVNGNLNPSVVTFADSGFYDVSLMVTNPNTGCKSLISKNDYIQVYPKPIAAFYANPDNVSILDPTINFVNTSQGANSYYWNFGDPAAVGATNTSTLTNPSHTYGFTGEYQVNLVATSIQGCKDTAQVMVEVKPDFALYIPNTFTPDGNGVNDIFQPMGVGINEEDYRMDIYDRWGENIFTSNAFRKGWDGTVKGGSKIAEQGVYTYKLMVKDVLGNKHPYVGHVTLLKKDN